MYKIFIICVFILAVDGNHEELDDLEAEQHQRTHSFSYFSTDAEEESEI